MKRKESKPIKAWRAQTQVTVDGLTYGVGDEIPLRYADEVQPHIDDGRVVALYEDGTFGVFHRAFVANEIADYLHGSDSAVLARIIETKPTIDGIKLLRDIAQRQGRASVLVYALDTVIMYGAGQPATRRSRRVPA